MTLLIQPFGNAPVWPAPRRYDSRVTAEDLAQLDAIADQRIEHEQSLRDHPEYGEANEPHEPREDESS